MKTMPYLIDQPERVIQIEDTVIDPARIFDLARKLDETECLGVIGDDNRNGWLGQGPTWKFRLTLPDQSVFSATVIRLLNLAGRRADELTLVARPKSPKNLTLPTFDRGYEAICKHTGSQLRDGEFRIDFRDGADQVWFQAKWLDTSLLHWMARPVDLENSLLSVSEMCDGFAHRLSAEEAEAMLQQELTETRARWINPAYRVFFVCRGHTFRVDRSGKEWIFAPLNAQDKS